LEAEELIFEEDGEVGENGNSLSDGRPNAVPHLVYSKEAMLEVRSELSEQALESMFSHCISLNEQSLNDKRLSERQKKAPRNYWSNFHTQSSIATDSPIPENLLQRTAEVGDLLIEFVHGRYEFYS
jgi:hypothetical protein